MTINTYKEYKNTGVEWLGKLPAHWDVFPLKAGFNLMKRPPPVNCGVVTAFRDGEVTLRSNRRMDGFTEAFQEIGYQGVEPNDLVIHAMDAFAGAIGVSDSKGKSTPVYSVCEPKKDYFSRYYGLVLRHIALAGFIQSLAKGIRERSTDFRWSDAKNIPVPHPSIDEQKSIINFLDNEISKIDSLITEQEKLIKLLKEKSQAVISTAVTKGLDTKVKMKESGVEWLGNIPEHWKIKKIKWCLKLKNEKTQERSNTIALENIEGWTGRFINTESEFEGDGVKFNQGDVLFGKLRPYLAKVFRATMSGEAIGDFFVLEPNQNLLSEFAERLLISSEFFDAINSSTYGTKMPRASWEYFSSMSIPLPPKHEQVQISNYLENAIKEMDDLIAKSNHAVALLQERRTALISAAVTGQIDVRNSYGN